MSEFINDIRLFAPISNWIRCGFEVIDNVLTLSNSRVVFQDCEVNKSYIDGWSVSNTLCNHQSDIELDHLMIRVPFESESRAEIPALIGGVRLDLVEGAVSEIEIWGIAFRVANLSDFTKSLDESMLSCAKPATQKNQLVSVFRGAAQLGIACALMSPAEPF